MDDELQRHLHSENQIDAPLSNVTDNYTLPDTLKGTLKSCMIWKYIIYGCFTAQIIAITMITIPIIGRQYFDESDDDINTDCDTDSYSKYAFWLSISYGLSGFVALISQSYIGRLSDAFGRKRFLYFVWICTVLQYIPLCFTANIWWYFALGPLAGFSGMINALPTILQSAISDITAPQFRTTVYGMLFGICGGTMIISSVGISKIIHYFGIRYAFYIIVGVKVLELIYLFFVMPETLKRVNRKPLDADKDTFEKNNDYLMKQQIELNKIGVDISTGNIQYDQLDGDSNCGNCCVKCKKCCSWKHNPLKPLCYVKKNKVILWIAVLSLLTAFPESGVNELAMIYVSDSLGLCDTKENSNINSYLVISMSFFMIISNLILLPILTGYVTDIKLIIIGVTILLITFLFGILIYFWSTIIAALLLYGFNGMSFVIIPILSGSLSKRVSPREQGVALGVIHAIKGLNKCIAPFIFSYLYWFFSDELNTYGILKAVPFMFGAFIILMVYPMICYPIKNVFNKYDEYAFRASVVPFDNNPDGHIPPQQLL